MTIPGMLKIGSRRGSGGCTLHAPQSPTAGPPHKAGTRSAAGRGPHRQRPVNPNEGFQRRRTPPRARRLHDSAPNRARSATWPEGPRAASKRDGDGRDGRRRKHGMKHATTRMIFAYWDALRGERSAPERGEIEPGEIRHVLADTFVLEVAPERNATIRLAGTRICAFFGRELRGEAFDRLWHPRRGRGRARMRSRPFVEEAAGVVAGLTAGDRGRRLGRARDGPSAVAAPGPAAHPDPRRALPGRGPALDRALPGQPPHDVLATRAVALGPGGRGSCAATTTVLRSHAGNASSSTPEGASEPAGG